MCTCLHGRPRGQKELGRKPKDMDATIRQAKPVYKSEQVLVAISPAQIARTRIAYPDLQRSPSCGGAGGESGALDDPRFYWEEVHILHLKM